MEQIYLYIRKLFLTWNNCMNNGRNNCIGITDEHDKKCSRHNLMKSHSASLSHQYKQENRLTSFAQNSRKTVSDTGRTYTLTDLTFLQQNMYFNFQYATSKTMISVLFLVRATVCEICTKPIFL